MSVSLKIQLRAPVPAETIIGIDPGGTTGIGVLRSYHREVEVLEALQLEHWSLVEDNLENMINVYRPDLVIVEDIRTGTRLGKSLIDVIKLIGSVRAICRRLQTPYMEKAAGARMPGMSYVVEVSGVHRRDALAHGITYFLNRQSAA